MLTDLRTFADRYTVRDDGSGDGCWSLEIPGAHGAIFPHNARGGLGVLALSSGAIRKLASLGLKVMQRGESEVVFAFEPRQLDQVASIVRAVRP